MSDKKGLFPEQIWKQIESAEKERAALMPNDEQAIKQMANAYIRLTELGWKSIIYCPKDGTRFEAIEPGASGIMKRCYYSGEWPKGSWWAEEGGDLWPVRPFLFRVTEDANEP